MPGPARLRLQFGLILVAHALGAMALLSVLTAGPWLATALGLSALQIGGLASVYSAALATASFPAGLVVDRLGTRAALTVSALLIASGLGVAASSGSYLPITCGVGLCGAGYGLINPAAGRAVTLWFRPTWRTTLLSLKQTGVPAGAALGSLTALVAPVWGWRVGIGCAAGVAVIAAVLFLAVLPRDKTARHAAPLSHSRVKQVLALPGLGRANLAAGVTNGLQFALWAHLPQFLGRSSNAEAGLLAASLGALHLGTFLGRLGWGPVTDRGLRGNAARALVWLCCAALFGVGALAVMAHWPAAAPIACAVLGATICAAVGLHLALTARIAPEHLLGGALGYTMLVANLGGVIVPVVLGAALSIGGAGAATATLAALIGLAVLLVRKL